MQDRRRAGRTALARSLLVALSVLAGAELSGQVIEVGGVGYPRIAGSPDGYLIVWGPTPGGAPVFGRRYGSDGAPTGNIFPVNTATNISGWSVGMDAAGNFIFVWAKPDGISGQRFTGAGIPEGDEFQVSTSGTGNPDIGVAADGSFVVAWGGSGRRFDNTGAPLGDEFPTPGGPVAMDGEGNFVVANAINGQRFHSDGTPNGPEFQVSTDFFFDSHSPDAAMNASGEFVVAWAQQSHPAAVDIWARRFDSSGMPYGDDFRITESNGNNYYGPVAAAIDVSANFIVTWTTVCCGIPSPESNILIKVAHCSDDAPCTANGQFGYAGYHHNSAVADGSAGFIVTWVGGEPDETIGVRACCGLLPDPSPSPTATETSTPTPTATSTPTATATNTPSATPTASHTPTQTPTATYTPTPTPTTSQTPTPTTTPATVTPTPVGGGYGPTFGEELQVNDPSRSEALQSRVAVDADGKFVVAFRHLDDAGDGVFARHFDPEGSPLGVEFRVSFPTSGSQERPDIAMSPSGDFVVVWESLGQDGSQDAVVGRRYEADGSPLGDEFQVNSYTTGGQDRPRVAMDSSGEFLVVWSSRAGQDGSAGGVFGQRYDGAGAPQGDEFQVNTYTPGFQDSPVVGSVPIGGFVVAWESLGQDGSGSGIVARRYDSNGSPLGDEFQVNTYTTGSQVSPTVAVGQGGQFIIAWGSQPSQDGSGFGIFAQRYEAGGAAVGGEFQVNSYTTGYQESPAVAAGPTDGFVIGWLGRQTQGDESQGFFLRRFDAAGNPTGTEFQINSYSGVRSLEPSLAVSANGTYVASWTGPHLPAAFEVGVFARIGFPLAAVDLKIDRHVSGASNLNGILEPEEAVIVQPEWQNTGVSALAQAGQASGFGGPSGGGTTYELQDSTADYGTLEVGTPTDCYVATQNCYQLMVSGPRPAPHWDATFVETLSSTAARPWTLHVGNSFADVPQDHSFYSFVENVFHNRVTAGCSGTQYCPENAVTRAQMAPFLLKAKHGADYMPPPCMGFFTDVDCPGAFTDWVEQLAAEGITAGCGVGVYCPSTPVRRDQMAVFLLKSKHGSGYTPPLCAGVFADLACPSMFADWVEQLVAEQVTAGCGNGNYCPLSNINRGQMAVFLVKTFGLLLYAP